MGTLREMLRIKRSVQAVYNTQVNMMASAMMANTTGGVGTVADLAPTMTMGLKDEIDISDDEDDEEEEGGDDGEPPKKKEKVAVEEMDVPDKVFGGLKKPTAD